MRAQVDRDELDDVETPCANDGSADSNADASNPCSNDGVCLLSSTLHGFKCKCTNGYEGELCEQASALAVRSPTASLVSQLRCISGTGIL